MKNVLLGILLAVCVAAGYAIGHNAAKIGPQPVPDPRVDTLRIYDTTTVYKPKYVYRTVKDTAWVSVPVTDTLYRHDTLYVPMPRELVVWEDSLARVYASGIMPSVDSVMHFTESMVINNVQVVKERAAWSIGVMAGYGAGKDGLSPFVGVGLTYDLLSIFNKK